MNKPFNLEAALNGAPVVNGLGTKIAVTKLAAQRSDSLIMVAQDANTGSIQSYNDINGLPDSGSVLFRLHMAPVTKTAYVNLLQDSEGKMYMGYTVCTNPEAAEQRAIHAGVTVIRSAIPITYEE